MREDARVVLQIVPLADRPDLAAAMWGMPSSWPEFMKQDPISNLYYLNVEARFAAYTLVAFEAGDGADEVVGLAHSVPFVRGDAELPDDGWDCVVRRGLQASIAGRTPDAVSAVEIAVHPDRQGTGLSTRLLAALRDNAARLGFAELVAPVRPSGKGDVHEPMAGYAFRTREDGLPVDPWLRVHVRAGGRIEKVAPRSMVIPGTLAEWRRWTGLAFDQTGPVEVPGALVPVHCDAEHGVAAYVEPNVWVVHRTGA